jgi:hypothetical protein
MPNDTPDPNRNRAIAGDNTPQPNYNRLSAAQHDLVDRAIYGKLIQGNDFSPATLASARANDILHPK